MKITDQVGIKPVYHIFSHNINVRLLLLHPTPLTPSQAVVEHGECQEDVIGAGQQDEQVVECVPHGHRGENEDREAVAYQSYRTNHHMQIGI